MKKIIFLNILMAVSVLSACDNNSNSNVLIFEPSSLATCDKASEVIVKWNVRTAYPDVGAVNIFVVDGASEVLFGVGGPVGVTKTGLWVRPGIPQFIIKDKASGKVLGEAAVSGPKCK